MTTPIDAEPAALAARLNQQRLHCEQSRCACKRGDGAAGFHCNGCQIGRYVAFAFPIVAS